MDLPELTDNSFCFLFFFKILPDLNQAVPGNTWFLVRQNLKKRKKQKDFPGWRPAIAFSILFLFHSLFRLPFFLRNKNRPKTRCVVYMYISDLPGFCQSTL